MLRAIALSALFIVAVWPGFAAAQPNTEATFVEAPTPSGDEVFIQSAAALDEPRHFCLDVPGFRRPGQQGLTGWRTDWPLGVHTCKTQIPHAHAFFIDQLLSREALEDGQLRFTRLGVCLDIQNIDPAPGHVREDAVVLMAECSQSPRQRFRLHANGQIRPQLDDTKCLTLGAETFEAGNRAPGEPWRRRDLSVSTCAATEGERQTWRVQTPPADD
jgi:hypothetical protein